VSPPKACAASTPVSYRWTRDDRRPVKFAVELGVSIMLNKPIIAMIEEGVPIPDKLAAVCDHVLVMPKDWRTNRAFQQKMMESLTEVKTRTLGA
jgi:hypothetical protein